MVVTHDEGIVTDSNACEDGGADAGAGSRVIDGSGPGCGDGDGTNAVVTRLMPLTTS